MKKFCLFFFSLLLFICLFPKQTYALDNPLTHPNNKIGIHILFDTELPQAARFVNSNGGDWGYITIPIQTGDKNLAKWQKFMHDCKKYHVIPILRLATEGDYFNTKVWRKPQLIDIIDFANFLNALDWPTKNRYIIVFNEVNRGDEWGGETNPQEYANILSFAVTVFKSKSPDYFIISAGLDNAAPNQGTDFINEYTYLKAMNTFFPAIFTQVDGMASHSYPNPGFSQPPDANSTMGAGSFKYEQDLINSLDGKLLPVFITETGWSSQTVSDALRIQYYQDAFANIWNDSSIVAITPFLLEANSGPFQKFSFLTATGAATQQYQTIVNLPKVKGTPSFPVKIA